MNWLVVIGLIVHIIFFYSIFDIYFTSPLVHGMTPHSTPLQAPAKRLVLFVTDGLRADKLFELDEEGKTPAQFLRNVVLNEGVWGVSHTRVPTESRPGHVALIAGFYEDVSAVTKGWKENPVKFDSVFNESRHTWSWGSPDILPMFAKGASGGHVDTFMYPAESEDFAGEDTSQLDTWVFESVKDFISQANNSTSLQHHLAKDKIVFFLHLLGIDTNGHSHKPNSREYYRNIQIVDAGIREISELIDSFYDHDNSTAFLVTSDHGMTNWGSHGAGDGDETMTPIIGWGAGLRGPRPAETAYEDGQQNVWRLEGVQRSDLKQADIAPLMSALIGIPYPLNSVGILPLDYIDSNARFKAESLLTNALQMLEQFQVKMEEKKKTTFSMLFKPFWPLTRAEQIRNIREIRGLLKDGNFSQAMQISSQLIELSLKGLRYYHCYDRFFLGVSVFLGFVGWMAFIFTVIIQEFTVISASAVKLDSCNRPFLFRTSSLRILFGGLGLTAVLMLSAQSVAWTHYLYCLLPVAAWYKVFCRYEVFADILAYIKKTNQFISTAARLCVGWIALELIIVCFFYRAVLSLGLIAMAFWPLITPIRNDKPLLFSWMASCLLLAVFPMMPVVGRNSNYNLVYLSGYLAVILAAFAIKRRESALLNVNNRNALYLSIFQILVLCASVYIIQITSNSISSKLPVPAICQSCSWLILGSSFTSPLFSSKQMLQRLLHISLAFMGPYILMSTASEGLFYLALCVFLYLWLQMELKITKSRTFIKLEDLKFDDVSLMGKHHCLAVEDLRRGYFFLFLVLTAFFGTGNIASINTFEPSSVYCFLTVFRPFTMGGLMMWKILIPILLVTCTFTALHVVLQVSTQSLLLMVLLISDFMAIHFFFLVREDGSWLEIGTSISHYVIVMCMIIFVLILLAVSKIFTSFTIKIPFSRKHHIAVWKID